MARDRKRAKQRQQRRAQGAPAPDLSGSGVHRADLPGALEHTGDVDEFDAALVRGAGGVPVEADAAEDAVEAEAPGAAVERAAPSSAELLPAGGGAGGGDGNGAATEAFGGAEAGGREPVHERRQPLPARAIGFLRASWAELQRVQWPNRGQVSQATAVVIGFVAVAGFYLGAADWVAQRIVNFIL